MIYLIIVLCLAIVNLIVINDKNTQKRICGLCAEHNEWAKREFKGCEIYGCIYNMDF